MLTALERDAGQYQPRHVRASDQEEHSYRGEQRPDRLPDGAEQVVEERSGHGRRTESWRSVTLELIRKPIELGRRHPRCDAFAQPSNDEQDTHVPEGVLAPAFGGTSQNRKNGCPELGASGKIEPCRHDANDGVGRPELHGCADDTCIGSERWTHAP